MGCREAHLGSTLPQRARFERELAFLLPISSARLALFDFKLDPDCHVTSLPQVDPSITSLLVTEPYNNLPSLQASYDQIVFEEYEFESYHRTTRGSLSLRQQLLFNSRRADCRSRCFACLSRSRCSHSLPTISPLPCYPVNLSLSARSQLPRMLHPRRRWILVHSHYPHHGREGRSFCNQEVSLTSTFLSSARVQAH